MTPHYARINSQQEGWPGYRKASIGTVGRSDGWRVLGLGAASSGPVNVDLTSYLDASGNGSGFTPPQSGATNFISVSLCVT